MRVVFRADGGGSVGWGHLGRCAALAEVLKRSDVRVNWACRQSSAVTRLTGSNAELPLPGAPTMSTLPLSEAEALARFSQGADWVVVDHYGASDAYIATLRQGSEAKILVFDDHQQREEADLRLAPAQAPRAKTLAGPAYQPVRPCFSRVPPAGERQGWVLALGGADPQDDTMRCLDRLPHSTPLTVLASDAIAERQGVDAALKGAQERVAWLAPAALAERFARARAALVSASTLAWEALATQTPIVALQTADNQAGVVAVLSAHGIPTYQDAHEAAHALSQGLAAVAPPDAMLDGLGAWRVAHAMGVDLTIPQARSPGSAI